jgi:hypothetical protein
MPVPRSRLALALAALAFLTLVAWIAWPADLPTAPDAPVQGLAGSGAATPLPAIAPAAPRAARTAKPGARTPVPRVVQNVAPAAVPAATPSPAPTPTGPVDRRENPPPGAEATRAAIMARMDDVSDEIAVCLDGWMALDPGLEGKVNMGFRLDADGLQEAWVADHSDVPFGPLSCFGAAIDGVDWAGVTAEPLEVTFPFTFTAAATP